nr:MAG TPA: hypothetical protein [Caudoviricetes sp.]
MLITGLPEWRIRRFNEEYDNARERAVLSGAK